MPVPSNNSPSHNPYAYRAHYAIEKYARANQPKVDEKGLSVPATLSKMQESTTKPSKEHPVCIIGAGPAGLYAAMILQSIGVPYRILEASGRVGGEPHCLVSSDES
jgi:NADPH-dependent 2,4-dienoyl-CoA reductase/sulfur reductase-like enzyme